VLININNENAEKLVVNILQTSYEMVCGEKTWTEEDTQYNENLKKGIDVVLDYYMTPQEKNDWDVRKTYFK